MSDSAARLVGVAHVGMNILGEFVGGHNAVAIGVRFTFHAFDDVVGEDAVPAAPFSALEGLLAIAAGRNGKQRLIQVQQLLFTVERSASGVMAPQ